MIYISTKDPSKLLAGAFQLIGRSLPKNMKDPLKDMKTNTKPVYLLLLVGAFVVIYISTKDPSKLLAGAFQR